MTQSWIRSQADINKNEKVSSGQMWGKSAEMIIIFETETNMNSPLQFSANTPTWSAPNHETKVFTL